ncbi:uncharacterized protein LOC107195601 isoform X2 [Pteropus alecto]|uniref:uncharacterized protein LOC107195601 isoform X2 n=1 Tax=Pteropus alecto TaxID=9402 RepID=UPI000D535909|nr:uncharacterized protein LOC107195601 isoform X2 [Pteropus alecto]XP_015444083.2 uncharacterized protein LOC107195601 isoform X2 [Pteropus alecto]XP_024901894.1 uncharacterized protein LOC107195601 isoform X2 [Pteropus alecto]
MGTQGPLQAFAARAAWCPLQNWRWRQWEVMELSRNSVDEMKKRTGLGHCRHFFWLGVIFDIVGATALFTGAFADLSHCGLLLYLGSIIVFFSLLWWVFWYSGNMELTPEEVWKGPLQGLSTTVLDTLRQNVSHRFSWSFCDVSTTFMRIRRLRARRRAGPLILTVTGQTAERTEEEDKDKDGMKNIKKSSDAEDCGREDVGPEPEAVQSSEGVCLPGPDAGPLGPEAGRPTFVERLWTQEVESEVTPSPLNQPLPPAILTSVVPLSSASQPPVIHASISLPLSFSAPASQDQQSVPHESASAPAWEKNSRPL